MSPPTILLNNLVKTEDTYFDRISKAYFIGDVVLGVNRLVLFGKIKPIIIILCSTYSLFLCGNISFAAFILRLNSRYSIGLKVQSVHYILSVIVNMVLWKRLRHFYQILQEFDMAVGCRPQRTAASIRNLIQSYVAVILVLLIIPYDWIHFEGKGIIEHITYLPMRLQQVIDIHFYGHLLSLLVPRLRLINYYMNNSLSCQKLVAAPKVTKLSDKSITPESHSYEMKKVMDLYSLVISAHDVLIDAIKWQFVMALTCMFISLLAFSYIASLIIIRGTRPLFEVAVEFSFIASRTLPLFAPCIFSDQIQGEVRQLREYVASRLYENKLNKPGRTAARALLSLTEARDLSFSLLQVFDIDISLPFKFVGLLLTYLIILLQLEKVINLEIDG